MKASSRAYFRGEAIENMKSKFLAKTVEGATLRREFHDGLYATELYKGKLDNPDGKKVLLDNGSWHTVYAEVAAWVEDQERHLGLRPNPTGHDLAPISREEWLGEELPNMEEELPEVVTPLEELKREIVPPLPVGEPIKRPLTKRLKDMIQSKK